MTVDDEPLRPLRALTAGNAVEVIDQRALPHRFVLRTLTSVEEVFVAIRDMWVRGAPLIGATAAYGYALQARRDASDAALDGAAQRLLGARPTAVNLAWALARMQREVAGVGTGERAAAAWVAAGAIAADDVAVNARIGDHGLELLQALAARRRDDRAVQVLTHCNAGWLATVGWGTATAPIYRAHAAELPLHVWVDETRPRNQGAGLTAWELGRAGVPHTVVADNAGGHLMQHGRVDIVIVGCDRVAANGDVCNKVGTYLKALAARDNDVPFYVAMPTSTFDPTVSDGVRGIPIEDRAAREVTHVAGRTAGGDIVEVQLTPDGTPAANPAFDVTPARLVTGLITEHGVVPTTADALAALAAKGAGRPQ